jgi:CHAD domain-containing protein
MIMRRSLAKKENAENTHVIRMCIRTLRCVLRYVHTYIQLAQIIAKISNRKNKLLLSCII